MKADNVFLYNTDVLEFVIFCIENLAVYLKQTPTAIYDKLKITGILDSYIIPEYEMLHSQSKEYIIEDIIEIMNERGVNI